MNPIKWLRRETGKSETARAADSAEVDAALQDSALPRTEAEARVILFQLDERMRTFRPMIERVLRGIENEGELEVLRPAEVTYGFDDRYFPTYEWKIFRKRTANDSRPDPRQVTLQLRASLGRDLSIILVYYLLSFADASGEEHPIHQQPTEIHNEKMIQSLLWNAIKAAGLPAPADQEPSS